MHPHNYYSLYKTICGIATASEILQRKHFDIYFVVQENNKQIKKKKTQ